MSLVRAVITTLLWYLHLSRIVLFVVSLDSNALMANVGMPQTRKYKDENGETRVYVEGKLITIGDEVNLARNFAKQDENGEWSYSAGAVVDYLKSEWTESEARQELKEILQSEGKSVDEPATTSAE